ncbi:MAG: hypothetical protein HY867_00480 [Chloroflexi bacterium]|nr:hypothetical protein [Chloroflexota bacterium]
MEFLSPRTRWPVLDAFILIPFLVPGFVFDSARKYALLFDGISFMAFHQRISWPWIGLARPRILLDSGDGSFKNAIQGIRMLNGNFRFFFALYFVMVLIGLSFSVLRYGIGAAIAGVDLLSVQVFPLTKFW